MREKCEKIIHHGINCFINRQLIYNFPEEIFADAGKLAVARIVIVSVLWYYSTTLAPDDVLNS